MTALLLMATLLAVDEISVQTRLEPPVTPFHKQARFSIVVESPPDVDITLPDMVERFGGLSVYGTSEYSRQTLRDGRIRTTETYTLDPVLIGDYVIEPVTVTWGDGQSTTAPSPPLRVRALTPEEEKAAEQFEADLEKPDLRGAALWQRWETWAIVALAAATLAALVWYMRRRAPGESASAPQRKPWEVAYERLRALDQRGYPQAGKVMPYYVDLSAIARYYIEDRFHVHAPEQTTPEFLGEIKGGGILTPEQEAMLSRFLRHCDLVKFARYQPTVGEMEQSFTDVLKFVDETVPEPEQAEVVAA